ncbi:MAG: hypothetical protein ACLFSL_03855 [Candidatus Woesearchaeota archaeon]
MSAKKSLIFAVILAFLLMTLGTLCLYRDAYFGLTAYSRLSYQDKLNDHIDPSIDVITNIAANLIISAQKDDAAAFNKHARIYENTINNLNFSEMDLPELRITERLFSNHLELFSSLNEHSEYYPGYLYPAMKSAAMARQRSLKNILGFDVELGIEMAEGSARQLLNNAPENQQVFISEAIREASYELAPKCMVLPQELESIAVTPTDLMHENDMTITIN